MKKKKTKDLEFELDIKFDEEITMIYLEFYDHAYINGWNYHDSYPTMHEAEQVACGVLVKETGDYYVIANSVGKNVCKDSALNPFLVLKSTVTCAITFTKEAL